MNITNPHPSAQVFHHRNLRQLYTGRQQIVVLSVEGWQHFLASFDRGYEQLHIKQVGLGSGGEPSLIVVREDANAFAKLLRLGGRVPSFDHLL